MASIIAYYRPRGIVGNYKIGILLDLRKTETSKVKRYTEDKSFFDQEYFSSVLSGQGTPATPKPNPKKSTIVPSVKAMAKTSSLFKKEEGQIVIYILSRFNYLPDKEEFVISIRDTQVAAYQDNRYEATQKGIEEDHKYDHIEQLVINTEGTKIEFIKIILVDMDIPNNPQLQQFKSEIRQLRQYMQ